VKRLAALLLLALLSAPLPAGAQDVPDELPAEAGDLLDALLAGLMGEEGEATPESLQKQVAEVGGVAFKTPVTLEYLDQAGLERYLRELIDSEYPPLTAEADQRTLVAFDLLAAGTDLRALRTRLLLENVVGFYDERPGRKRLFAVSSDHALTMQNRVVMVHELRHALQDQYAQVHDVLPKSVSDFDDRRLAFMSILEGDATLVMMRYLGGMLGGLGGMLGGGGQAGGLLDDMPMPEPPVDGAPPVLRDQLVRPYFAGLTLAKAIEGRSGIGSLREAWARPPRSMEQVLHPEKYFSGEAPQTVRIDWAPERGRLLLDGVLGEAFAGTLLGTGDGPATEGWGGDSFRSWDVDGRSVLVFRSQWDTPADEAEFRAALRARFEATHGGSLQKGPFRVMTHEGWRVAVGGPPGATILVRSDSPEVFEQAIAALGRNP
jgi:hypothetical protein